MPRKKLVTPPRRRILDSQFFDHLQAAGGVILTVDQRIALKALVDHQRTLPGLQAAYRRHHGMARRREDGRPSSVNRRALVCGALAIFESAGGRITATKNAQGRVVGAAADFLRVLHGALASPGLTEDGFARQVIEAWRDPRARARRARESYLERTRNAWKS